MKKNIYENPDWSKIIEPFHIAGKLYYVGTYELGSYLITTEKGNILTNTVSNGSAPIIKRNIEKLGFRYLENDNVK